MRQAAKTMDDIRSGSEVLLLSAMKNDRETAKAVMTLRGPERVQRVVYGMAMEERRQQELGPVVPGSGFDAQRGGSSGIDPADGRPETAEAKASRLVRTFGELKAKRTDIGDSYGENARLDRDMRNVAQAVKDDPEVERILADRARAQGIEMKDRTISQEMERQIRQRERDKDRDRDRGLER